MNNLPLVSICIPTFNQFSFILETLESCLRQTYSNIEIIVVDDCSTDQTAVAIKKYVATHTGIRFIQNSVNLGVERNWNLALASARGIFIKILCGDDLLSSDCIEKQVEALLKFPDVAMVSCNRDIIDHKSQIILSPKRSQFFEPTSLKDGIKKVVRSGTNPIGEPACVLFRRTDEVFDAKHPYLIDLDFWFKLWRHGKVLVIKESLASFRIHPSSLTSLIGLKHFYQYKEFIRKISLKHSNELHTFDKIVSLMNAFILGFFRNIFISYRIWFLNKKVPVS